MLKGEVLKGGTHDIKVAKQALVISHLFFADDSLMFARDNVLEERSILVILQRYQVSLVQIVNWDKSEASFSRNMEENVKSSIYREMGVKMVTSHAKYLGFPVIFGRSKKDVFFAMVKEIVWKNIKGWKEKFLSRAGKEVLIKEVVQVIPSYVMSYYKLPESCWHEIEAMISKFLWERMKAK